MATPSDEDLHRRFDQQYKVETLDGMARLLDVLHDISASLQIIATKPDPSVAAPDPSDEKPPALLGVKEAAAILGVSVGTLNKWRLPYALNGPPAIKIGTRVRYRHADIETWLNQQVERPHEPSRAWRSEPQGRIGSTVKKPIRKVRCPGSSTDPTSVDQFGLGTCSQCHSTSLAVTEKGKLYRHKCDEQTADRTCIGSYTEPRQRVGDHGDRGICAVCGDNVGLLKTGKLRKHQTPWTHR